MLMIYRTLNSEHEWKIVYVDMNDDDDNVIDTTWKAQDHHQH